MSETLVKTNVDVRVRPYRPEDYAAIVAIWQVTRQKAFTEAQIARLLRCEGQMYVAEVADEAAPVGVIAWGHNGQSAYLYRLAVAENQRGRGLATALVARAEAEIIAAGFERAALHVFEGNVAARSLYAGLGYENLLEVEYWAKSLNPEKDARGHKREPNQC